GPLRRRSSRCPSRSSRVAATRSPRSLGPRPRRRSRRPRPAPAGRTKGRRTTKRRLIGPTMSNRENRRPRRPRPSPSRRPRPNARPTTRSGSNDMPAARGCARPAWRPAASAVRATRLSRVLRIAKLGERTARRISADSRRDSLEGPTVPFAEQFAEEAGGLRPVQLHEERAKVFAHESADRSIRSEVDAVMLEAFLLSVDEDGVVLHATGEERLRLLVDGNEGRVDCFCRGEPVPSQEDEEELLEGHLVDVLIQ